MTAKEIAARIDAYLDRFERDPKINKCDKKYGTRDFYFAGAHASGGWIHVTYITYQGGDNLRKSDAERYLAWLDAGNIGRHWEALREVPI